MALTLEGSYPPAKLGKTMERDVRMSAYDVSVHFREERSGDWIIREETSGKGGRFADPAAAMEFIRAELGLRARPVSASESEDAAGVILASRPRRKRDFDED